MKINQKAYPLVAYDTRHKQFTDELFRMGLYTKIATSSFGADQQYMREYREFISYLGTERHIKSYLVAQPVVKYMMKDGMILMEKMWSHLPSLPDSTCTILMNGWTCFLRKFTSGGNVIIFYYAIQGDMYDIGLIRQDPKQKIQIEAKLRADSNMATGIGMTAASLVLPFLTFAECETKIINSATQHKVKINKEKYVSDIPEDLEIVDSNWFTTIIRTGGFGVHGHFRLQPIGTKRGSRKLIWIKDFEKHGYTRRAHIERINE